MPITQSAKKALRGSKRKQAYGLKRKEAYKTAVKEVRKFISLKNRDEAQKLLPKAYRTLDKAAKTGAIKKNKASRLKSRIMLALNKLNKDK